VRASTRGDLKKAGAALAHAIVLAGIDAILAFLGAKGRGEASEAGGVGRGIAEDPWPEWPRPGASAAEARQAAEALEGAARAKAAAEGEFTPSWAVDAASQGGWESVRVADMTPAELDLVQDVMAAPEVIVGRSINVRGRGPLTLDEWLVSKNIQWTQRWQDVYNHSLYLRTSTGSPVNVMPGAGYSAGEAAAAERGATVSGVSNVPYWPDSTPP
jgi:hypothetical protein